MPLEGTTDFFLKQGTALRLLYERAEPLLSATKFVRPVQDDKDSFVYRYDNVGAASDPKKKKPGHAMIGGDFPEIDMSRATYAAGMTEARGFQIRIKRKTLRDEPKGVAEIQRAYKIAGYWMAQFIHDDVLAAIKAGATTPTWTPKAVWGDGSATPVDDLIRLEEQMEREGYTYALTDVLIHKTNWYEFKGYLTSADINEAKQRLMYGVPEIRKDSIHVPVVGADIWKIKSGMTEGYVLGLDRDNPCAELHYYVDPKFGSATVQYETIIDGKKQMVTADNVGFQFYTYEEQATNDQILRFSVESKAVVTEAYAALYDNGI
ncbi:MAG: hypothetical protein Q8R70_04990 [Methanoregula sp.]|nr:hypothetical protein [Methanoregula sp.]